MALIAELTIVPLTLHRSPSELILRPLISDLMTTEASQMALIANLTNPEVTYGPHC